MGPTSVTQLLLLLLFVVPGFVHQAVRISVRGRLPLDIELSTRIVRAIVSSGIFALVYLGVLGQDLIDAAHGQGYGFEHPRVGALLALLGGIVVPALLALLRLPEWGWLQQLSARLPQVTKYDATPTAWDKTFQTIGECFIRVLNDDGRWIAGYSVPRRTPPPIPSAINCSSRRRSTSARTARSEGDRRLTGRADRLWRDTVAPGSSRRARDRGGPDVSRWLPPAGGGYSGRSAVTGRYLTRAAAARHPMTAVTEKNVKSGKTSGGKTTRSATTGRVSRVTPKSEGSAGVSRAR